MVVPLVGLTPWPFESLSSNQARVGHRLCCRFYPLPIAVPYRPADAMPALYASSMLAGLGPLRS